VSAKPLTVHTFYDVTTPKAEIRALDGFDPCNQQHEQDARLDAHEHDGASYHPYPGVGAMDADEDGVLSGGDDADGCRVGGLGAAQDDDGACMHGKGRLGSPDHQDGGNGGREAQKETYEDDSKNVITELERLTDQNKPSELQDGDGASLVPHGSQGSGEASLAPSELGDGGEASLVPSGFQDGDDCLDILCAGAWSQCEERPVCTVLIFLTRFCSSPVLLGFPMLCDVISAVTEFMAKVLQLPRAVRIPDVV
jgi:hypothetical protein